MKRLLWILPLLLLFSCNNYRASRGPADWIYVATTGNDGTGDGSAGAPYLTLGHAVTQATAGDTIYVTAGTYNIGTQIDLPVGISLYGAGATSILLATAAVNPLIELSSVAEGTNGNQSISYLKLDGNNLTGTRAIYVNLRSNVKIHHLTVEDFSAIGIEFDGIASGTPTTHSTGNEIYSCTLTNTCGRSGAIRFNGQSGLLIHDNTLTGYQRTLGHDPTLVSAVGGYNKGLLFYNNVSNMDRMYFAVDGTTALWGFHFEHWDCQGGHQVYNNTFNGGHVPIDVGGTFNLKGDYDYSWDIHDNVWQWSSQYPTQVDGSFGLVFEGGVSDLIVRENLFRNVPWGIASSIIQPSRVHQNISIRYNVFENIGWGNDVWGFGIWIGQGQNDAITRNINIDNNTMSSGTGAGGSATAGIMFNSTGDISNAKIRNNIIQNIVTYGCIGFYDGAGTIDSITIQTNILYNNVNTNDFYYRNGKTVSALVNSGNIESDPLFKSSTDFHLQSTSPAINAGTSVGLTSDYYGHRVPQNDTVDIGAHEYGDYLVKFGGLYLRDGNGKLKIIH